MSELIAQGSSKDIFRDLRHPEHLLFHFTDRVSVFDYGAISDEIPHKGKNLERVARHFEKVFQSAGIPSAFDAVLSKKISRYAVHAARHPRVATVSSSTSLEFIPLEVIFRWGIPQGSSLLLRRPDLKAGTRFPEVMIEFSTKLEASDRMLERAEAEKLIAGSSERLKKIEKLAEKVSLVLRDHFKNLGLELWDGKLECAWDITAEKVLLVDALTLDELRVTLPGLEKVPLSKELLRQWMSTTLWSFEVAKVKKERGGDPAWKAACPLPPRLGFWRREKLSALYAAWAQVLEEQNARALVEWMQKETRAPKVFVKGAGGREEALRWRLQNEKAELAAEPECESEHDAILITQDADLEKGLVDEYLKKQEWVIGASRNAARIEWSKEFGKEIARAAGVPTARSTLKLSEIRNFSSPPVVKKDGLAAGKGVVVPATWEECERVAKEWTQEASTEVSAETAKDKSPDKPPSKILFEERLQGFEASAFFFVQTGYRGVRCACVGTAKDFKRRFAGDEGPNTGGMGAYAPHPELSADDLQLFQSWAQKTAEELAKRGLPYNGFLYLGLMKDLQLGWRLLEYNARPGDPETQALVKLWPQDEPLLRSLLALDIRSDFRSWDSGQKVLCLSLVNPAYPSSGAMPIELPEWFLPTALQERVTLFKTSSKTGRLAYVVADEANYQEAGDFIFEALVESPWKNLVEWRPDLLP